MNRNVCSTLVTLLFVFGCAPQPTEEQKIAIEKDIAMCLFSRTAPMGDNIISDAVFTANMLKEVGVNLSLDSFMNKKWRLDTDEVSQKETVTVEFEHQNLETEYSCSFTTDSEGKYRIESVLKNDEEIFDRQEDERIKKEKRVQLENYLSEVEKAAGEDITEDKITGSVTYRIKGETNLFKSIFGSVSSTVIGAVIIPERNVENIELVKAFMLTRQYVQPEDTLDSVEIIFKEGSTSTRLSFPCNYDYSTRSKYGNAYEGCDSTKLDMSELRALGDAGNLRVSSKNHTFDSIDGTDSQKTFIQDLKRIAKTIAKPN